MRFATIGRDGLNVGRKLIKVIVLVKMFNINVIDGWDGCAFTFSNDSR